MKPTSYIFNSKLIVLFRRAIAILVTLSLICCGIYFIQCLTRAKTAETRDLLQKTYFENPEQYDVIFLGTSHVMDGISPFDIWDECRITSYNWGSPSCTIPSMYWKLINILDYQKPELVVVDCFRATLESKTYSEYRMHDAFDAFPLSLHKYQAVKDLMENQLGVEEDDEYTKEEMMNILLPISAYHTRWESLEQVDFVNDYVDTKGCEFAINVSTPIEISHTNKKLEITEKMVGVVYLRKIIEECQKRDIPILLTYLPYPTEEFWKMESNMIDDIAEEYDVNYLNFCDLDVVNYDVDYADSASHMNVVGQEKVSRYIGNYILDNYEIESHTSDYRYFNEWNNGYKEYRNYKDDLVKSQSSLLNYLMLLHNSPNTLVIEIKDNSLLENSKYVELFNGLCNDCCFDENTKYLVIKDGHSVRFDDSIYESSSVSTELGNFMVVKSEGGNSLLLNDHSIYNGSSEEYAVAIQVIKNDEQFDKVLYYNSINDQLTRE